MKTRGKEEKLVGCDSPQLINNPTGPVSGALPSMGSKELRSNGTFLSADLIKGGESATEAGSAQSQRNR